MSILLVQHGEAKSKEQDRDRSLTDAGIRKTKKMAAWLSQQAINITEIQHSGKKRAAQTADIFAGRLEPAKGVHAVSGLNPNDDVEAYAANISKSNDTLMVVGHLPFLEKLASLLIGGNQDLGVISFVNSGIVSLEQNNNAWSVQWIVSPELIFA